VWNRLEPTVCDGLAYSLLSDGCEGGLKSSRTTRASKLLQGRDLGSETKVTVKVVHLAESRLTAGAVRRYSSVRKRKRLHPRYGNGLGLNSLAINLKVKITQVWNRLEPTVCDGLAYSLLSDGCDCGLKSSRTRRASKLLQSRDHDSETKVTVKVVHLADSRLTAAAGRGSGSCLNSHVI
jgi:hypothetical protein